MTAFATYAFGPVTVGYQRSEANGGSAGQQVTMLKFMELHLT
jgi:hypothetical protein